jgi:tRNA(His) 5'-end guanylyltransferase
MSNDSLGDRMKSYENISRHYLTKRTPAIIRLDGKAFHTLTKGFQRPFDSMFIETMWEAAKYLCENVMGCKIAYVQSDEISLLLTDWDTLTTQAWFEKNIQKMVSVSASMATMAFNKAFASMVDGLRNSYYNPASLPTEEQEKQLRIYESKVTTAMFDSRVFTIPKEEVCNCFIWRQQDCTRNMIEMMGRAHFSHKELYKVNCNQIQEKLWQEKQINFNDLPTYQKRGACIVKEYYDKDGTQRSRWVVDKDIPIFTQDREYIERYL